MRWKLWKDLKPDFTDERGEIFRILDDGKTSIKSVLLITCNKGAIRANHYHKNDSHYVYMLKGSMEYIEEDLDGKNKNMVIVKRGDLVYTPPMKAHAMHFLEEASVLTLATESRHQEAYEKDTVRMKLI